MSNTIIVVVSDPDNAARGEINVMETPQKAARLVETLLESGYEQERIRVFSAEEFQMQVHHRPVVSLMTAEGDEAPPETDSGSPSEDADQEEEAPVATAASATVTLNSAQPQEEATPFERNGVRFSTQFRPA
ncbi:MAG TPA: hypothetical protein VMR52_12195 [Dehalococcoidia bacterium]|nr:hypothetical protein [Dehalococcoidia bacterium]